MLQGEDEGDLALRIAQRRDRLARLRERLAEALQRDEVGDDVGLRGRRTRYVVALERFGEAFAQARETIAPLRDAQREVTLVFTLQHLAAIAALRPGDDAARVRYDRVRAAGLL